MKITTTQLRRIIKEEISKVLNEALTPGTRATYSHPDFPALGTITGVIEMDNDEMLFMPDEKFHDKVYRITQQEPEAGLYIDGANVAAI